MSITTRIAAGGALAALLAGLALVPQLPPARADEASAGAPSSTAGGLFSPSFDPDDLVKFDFMVEPGVSETLISTTTVRKIGFGRTRLIEIVTTPSGVYSSDGLASPHIRYPGIHKQWKDAPHGRLALWSDARGWEAHTAIDAGSFVTLVPFTGGAMLMTEDGGCLFVGAAAYC